MEAPDPNPMPEVNLGVVDFVKEAGRRLVGLCSYYPETGYPSSRQVTPPEVEPVAVTGWNAQGRFVDEHGEEW